MRVTLVGVSPPIWRQLLVPSGTSLGELHKILQVTMGWQDLHLHSFQIGDICYSCGDEEEDLALDEVDEDLVTIGEAFASVHRGFYEYDFGDGWRHELVCEEPTSAVSSFSPFAAFCLAGERACPPEDCGGVSGYSRLLSALDAPRRDEIVAIFGSQFDPEAFQLEAVNAALQELG